jgi:hypothetical protein
METSEISPDELRDLYIRANPRQRYRVALDRIEGPELGPSLFVNVMSALEGFARTVAVHAQVEKGEPVEAAYSRLRNVGPIQLIADHICPAYRMTPAELFAAADWASLPDAVKFRNLLVHEATFLNGGTSRALIEAARRILDRLAKLSGAV